jgi:hypothetical protein
MSGKEKNQRNARKRKSIKSRRDLVSRDIIIPLTTGMSRRKKRRPQKMELSKRRRRKGERQRKNI